MATRLGIHKVKLWHSLCALSEGARHANDFSAADAHRQRLIQLGYEVRTSSEGTSAKKKRA